MTENMKMFLEIASKNEELREQLNKMDKEALIAAAKELGIELTDADFTPPAGKVSDDELEAVAGGAACYCAVGGGGTATSEDEYTCACVAFGTGLYDWRGHFVEVQHKEARCICSVGGYGCAE